MAEAAVMSYPPTEYHKDVTKILGKMGNKTGKWKYRIQCQMDLHVGTFPSCSFVKAFSCHSLPHQMFQKSGQPT